MKRIRRKPPPVAYYDPVDKPQPERQVTAWATERQPWTPERLEGALYLLIDMMRTGYSIAYRPQGNAQGRCIMAIGEPDATLLDLCQRLGVPVVDLSPPGFSLRAYSEYNGIRPEYGGDLVEFLDACRRAGADVRG